MSAPVAVPPGRAAEAPPAPARHSRRFLCFMLLLCCCALIPFAQFKSRVLARAVAGAMGPGGLSLTAASFIGSGDDDDDGEADEDEEDGVESAAVGLAAAELARAVRAAVASAVSDSAALVDSKRQLPWGGAVNATTTVDHAAAQPRREAQALPPVALDAQIRVARNDALEDNYVEDSSEPDLPVPLPLPLPLPPPKAAAAAPPPAAVDDGEELGDANDRALGDGDYAAGDARAGAHGADGERVSRGALDPGSSSGSGSSNSGSRSATRAVTPLPPPPLPPASAHEPPEPESSAARRARRRPHERFLVIMNVAEGLASWTHALFEMMELARKLGRTVVEPCVRDGRIVTCVPGRVHAVPFGLQDAPAGAITARTDPLALPSLTCRRPQPAAAPEGGDAALAAVDAELRATALRLTTRRRGRRRRRRRRGGGGGAQQRRAAHAAAAARAAAAEVASAAVDHGGWAYPLHAYLDLAYLRQLYRHWVSFDDWLAIERGASDSAISAQPGGVLLLPLGYCATKTGQDDERLCDSPGGNVELAPWAFRRMVTRWGAPDAPRAPGERSETQHVAKALGLLRADASRSLVLFNVWRGCVSSVDTYEALPAFNSVHAAAVRAWLAASIAPEPGHAPSVERGHGRYVAWQWRSETVKQDAHFEACYLKLSELSKEATRPLKRDRARGALLWAAANGSSALHSRRGGAPPASPRVSVLVADIPAPANACRLWGVYEASHAGLAGRAVAKLLAPSVGMLKYDEEHPALDAGVLSIRDYLLATEADWYVTCRGRNGAECLGCFRAGSYFTRKISEARVAAGRRPLQNWFGVRPGDFDVG